MKNNGFFIASGGKVVAIAAAITLVLFMICDTLGILAAALTLFSAYVFRNDSRHIFANTQNILSPVDGVVNAIDKDENGHIVYCKVSILGSHKVLAPIEGKFNIKRSQKGLNLDPNSFKASLLNEQAELNISNEELSKNIDIKLISGKCNTPMQINSNEIVSQGEAIATLVDGIVVIRLGNDVKLNVKIGEDLKAGQTNLIA